MSGFESFELKKGGSKYPQVPPVGAYAAVIKNAHIVEPESVGKYRRLEMMIDITEGEFKNRYTEMYNDQKERFGSAYYKGLYSLKMPTEGMSDNDKKREWIGKQLYWVFESNLKEGDVPVDRWDGDPKSLIGKKVGILVNKKLYTGNDGEDKEKLYIYRFIGLKDLASGNYKLPEPWDTRAMPSVPKDEPTFTEVESVDVPW